jgi:hypothetical protein
MAHDSRFDHARHRAETLGRLRREVEHLHAYRARLERLLALALLVACSHTTVEPLGLLAVLEQFDLQVESALATSDDSVRRR